MTAAILVTLFCFLPTGVAAIVFASRSKEQWKAGDLVGATEAARKARLFVIVSIVAGCLAWLLIIAVGLGSDTTTTYMPLP
ncbi:CD225/dispanin family protein [Streptomyces sp. NPDC007369]|uniref:CD225/dispanin family protein n=1 Tax=Streptomyces sp. NPDC007369 TaxID=3154589 RepID=UPI00340E7BF0